MKTNNTMNGVWFILFWIVALVVWTLLQKPDNSYLNDPYLPDEGYGECVMMPSGNCV